MNKTVIGAIVGVLALGAVAIFILNQTSDAEPQTIENDSPNSITRPAVQAVPNTFSIMTPEEKAAADEAARIAAKEAEQEQASSSASSTEDMTQATEESQ